MRYIEGPGGGRKGSRLYDTDLGGKRYVEVKGGQQRLTERVRRQILRDQQLKAQGHVKDVKWIFYERKPGEVSKEVVDFAHSCGLTAIVETLPQGFK